MSEYRRAKTEGGTYFFTVVSYRRRNILCDGPIRAALKSAIQDVRSIHPFHIDAWVLLPDHLHCIWTMPVNDADFSLRWAMIKRSVSKQCGGLFHRQDWMSRSKSRRKESTIWQRRFWEHQIQDDEDYRRHMDYLHYNPVKHGYVAMANDWVYSSFHRYVAKGVYPGGWGGMVGDSEETGFGE